MALSEESVPNALAVRNNSISVLIKVLFTRPHARPSVEGPIKINRLALWIEMADWFPLAGKDSKHPKGNSPKGKSEGMVYTP